MGNTQFHWVDSHTTFRVLHIMINYFIYVALMEEWSILPQNIIMRLVKSMRHLCQMVEILLIFLFGAIFVIVLIFRVLVTILGCVPEACSFSSI